MTYLIRRAQRTEKTISVDTSAADSGRRPEELKRKYKRGDKVPLVCWYCGDVFEWTIKGPGRWPVLCPVCREDKEARQMRRRRD